MDKTIYDYMGPITQVQSDTIDKTPEQANLSIRRGYLNLPDDQLKVADKILESQELDSKVLKGLEGASKETIEYALDSNNIVNQRKDPRVLSNLDSVIKGAPASFMKGWYGNLDGRLETKRMDGTISEKLYNTLKPFYQAKMQQNTYDYENLLERIWFNSVGVIGQMVEKTVDLESLKKKLFYGLAHRTSLADSAFAPAIAGIKTMADIMRGNMYHEAKSLAPEGAPDEFIQGVTNALAYTSASLDIVGDYFLVKTGFSPLLNKGATSLLIKGAYSKPFLNFVLNNPGFKNFVYKVGSLNAVKFAARAGVGASKLYVTETSTELIQEAVEDFGDPIIKAIYAPELFPGALKEWGSNWVEKVPDIMTSTVLVSMFGGAAGATSYRVASNSYNFNKTESNLKMLEIMDNSPAFTEPNAKASFLRKHNKNEVVVDFDMIYDPEENTWQTSEAAEGMVSESTIGITPATNEAVVTEVKKFLGIDPASDVSSVKISVEDYTKLRQIAEVKKPLDNATKFDSNIPSMNQITLQRQNIKNSITAEVTNYDVYKKNAEHITKNLVIVDNKDVDSRKLYDNQFPGGSKSMPFKKFNNMIQAYTPPKEFLELIGDVLSLRYNFVSSVVPDLALDEFIKPYKSFQFYQVDENFPVTTTGWRDDDNIVVILNKKMGGLSGVLDTIIHELSHGLSFMDQRVKIQQGIFMVPGKTVDVKGEPHKAYEHDYYDYASTFISSLIDSVPASEKSKAIPRLNKLKIATEKLERNIVDLYLTDEKVKEFQEKSARKHPTEGLITIDDPRKGNTYHVFPNEILARSLSYYIMQIVDNNPYSKEIFRNMSYLSSMSLWQKGKYIGPDNSVLYEGFGELSPDEFTRLLFGETLFSLDKRPNMDPVYGFSNQQLFDLAQASGLDVNELKKEFADFNIERATAIINKISNSIKTEYHKIQKIFKELYDSNPAVLAKQYIESDKVLFNKQSLIDAYGSANLIPDKYVSEAGQDVLSDVAGAFKVTDQQLIDALNGKSDIDLGKLMGLVNIDMVNDIAFKNHMFERKMLNKIARLGAYKIKDAGVEKYSSVSIEQILDKETNLNTQELYNEMYQRAIDTGDIGKAIEYKDRLIYLSEAIKVADMVQAKMDSFAKSYNSFKKNASDNQVKYGYDFFNAIMNIYRALGLSTGKYKEETKTPLKTINDFVNKYVDKVDNIPNLSVLQGIHEKVFSTGDLRVLNPVELHYLDKVIKGIKSAGSSYNNIRIENENINIKGMQDVIAKDLERLKNKRSGDLSKLASINTDAIGLFTVFSQLKSKGINSLGVDLRNILLGAANKSASLTLAATKKIDNLVSTTITKSYYTGKGNVSVSVGDATFKRRELVSFAHHAGNFENLIRLVNSKSFAPFLQAVEFNKDALTKSKNTNKNYKLLNDLSVKLLSLLDNSEQQYVQGLWNLMQEYGKMSDEVMKRTNDYIPPKKYLFDLSSIGLQGGYFPLRVKKEAKSYFSLDTERFNRGNDIIMPFGDSFYQKDLVGYNYEVDLEPGIIMRFFSEASRQIAYREPSQLFRRLFYDGANANALGEMLNSKFDKYDALQIMADWFNENTSNYFSNADLESGLLRVLNRMRNGAIYSRMAYKNAVAILQLSGLGTGIAYTKNPLGVGASLVKFFMNPNKMMDQNNRYSALLATRGSSYNRDIVDFFSDGNVMKYDNFAKRAGFFLNKAFDLFVSHVVFDAEYKKQYYRKIKEMSPEDAHIEATREAENAVGMSQGSGTPVFQSHLLASKNAWMRFFTTFTSWGNNIYNQIHGTSGWHKVLILAMSAVFLPMLEQVIKGSLTGTLKDAEDEDGMIRIATEWLAQIVSYIPYVGGVIGGSLYSSSRGGGLVSYSDLSSTVSTIANISTKLYKDKELKPEDWFKILTGVGVTVYMSTGNSMFLIPDQARVSFYGAMSVDDVRIDDYDEMLTHLLIKNRKKR